MVASVGCCWLCVGGEVDGVEGFGAAQADGGVFGFCCLRRGRSASSGRISSAVERFDGQIERSSLIVVRDGTKVYFGDVEEFG